MRIFEEGRITQEEAVKFRQKAEKVIFAYLAPIPPEIGYDLSIMIRKEQLEIHNDKNYESKILPRCDSILTAKGHNHIYKEIYDFPEPVRALITNYGEISPLGGIAYKFNNSQMKQNNHIAPILRMPYIVGQMKKGQQFDCSESQVIWNDCSKITQDIFKNCSL
jgi:hypothetical protein